MIPMMLLWIIPSGIYGPHNCERYITIPPSTTSTCPVI